MTKLGQGLLKAMKEAVEINHETVWYAPDIDKLEVFDFSASSDAIIDLVKAVGWIYVGKL